MKVARNVNIRLLVLAVVLATGVVAAPAARAESPAQLTAEAGTVKVAGKQISPGTFVRLARKVTCEKLEGSGPATNGATTLEGTTAVSANCKDEVLEKPVTAQTNGCTLTIHLTAHAQSPEDRWTSTVDLVCSIGPATLTIYNNAAHTEVLCKYTFATQAGKTTTTLTNVAAGTKVNGVTTPKDFVIAHATISAIKSTRVEGSALVCGAESNETATLTGEGHLWGMNAAEEKTGITISTK
jgi:hypothetical protein